MNGTVGALQEFEDRLIAAGPFTGAGTVPLGSIGAWDGKAWSPLGAGVGYFVTSLTVYNGELIAGGWFGAPSSVVRWDGVEWHPVGSTPSWTVDGLGVHEEDLLAAGASGCGFECSVPRVDRWNGVAWQLMGTLPPGFLNSTATAVHVHQGTLFAGAFNLFSSLVQRWDGAGWTPVGATPGHWWGVRAMATFRGDLIGAAYGTGFSSGVGRWNGQDWVALGSGTNGSGYALAVHDGVLVVAGDFTSAGGLTSPYWARWGCACYADCNHDAQLTVADFGCFQTQFVLGHLYADCNSDGVLSVADFGCFQTKFVAGCP